MPESVAIVLATKLFADVTIGTVLFNLALSTAIKAVFSPSPKAPPSAANSASLADRSQTLTSLQSAAAWQIVYGQVEKGGTIVFRHTTDMVGEEGTSEKHVVPQTAPYTVTLAGAADYLSTSLVRTEEWRTVGGENEYFYVDLVETTGTPAAGEYSVTAGVYTFSETEAGKSFTVQFVKRIVTHAHADLHLIVVLAAHECEEITTVYFNGEEVPLDGTSATGRYAETAWIYKHLGADDQEADAALMAAAPTKWTSNHRLRGHCYLYVKIRKNFDVYPTGLPNITALIKGRKVYDPRSDTTVWSHNFALCVADYLNNPTWGLGAAYGTEINNDLLSAAANISDEAVSLAVGGTEDRYAVDGIVDTSQNPQDIIEKLLTAGAGRLVYVGGTWRLRAGAYITPAVTLDEGDARGPIRVQTRLSRRESFNAVKGVHISPDNNWQPADFPSVTNALYYAEDGNERVWFDMELPFTKSVSGAQRIAKIELEQVRQQITISYPAKLVAYKVEPPETLMLTNTRFGYTAKVFDLVESRLVVDQDDQGNPVLGVNLALRETASTVYDWNSGEETTVDAAPDTDLPDPRQVAPPGIPSVSELIYETASGSGVKSKAIVTWAAAPAGQAWRYEHEYKLKSAADWIPHGGLLNGTRDEIEDLAAGVYQSRVRAVSVLGARSAWSQSEYEIVGLTAPPADLTGFSMQVLNGLAHLVWDRAPDPDVRIGGFIRIRWSPTAPGATWNASVDIGPSIAGGATQTTLPLLPGTYLAKAVDSTGHGSVNAVSITTNAPSVLSLNLVETFNEHGAWAGLMDGVVFDGGLGGLKLDSNTLVDDILYPIDDWSALDDLGGVRTSGTYYADNSVDLGAVYTSRVTADIEAEGYDALDFIDSRMDPLDDWITFDGDVVDDATAKLFIRTTNDNPLGSPSATWSDWMPFIIGDYRARAFQFKVEFTTALSTHNVLLSALTITVDMPDRVEGAEDIASGTGTHSVTYTLPFKVPPAVGITAQNMATGDYYVVTAKTATGFSVAFKNAGGSGVNRAFDWIAKGYGTLQ